MNLQRCSWVTNEPILQVYHDKEWGNLQSFENDHYLFEMLTLEGAQAGLSWITILRRREAYRKAFMQFDPKKVASLQAEDVEELLMNKGIIRHRRKIESVINNAQVFLQVQHQHGSFHSYLWDFFEGKQLINHWESDEEVPAQTEASAQLSKELKKKGFTFIGPIICYSYMQAIGLVDDHTKDCFLATDKNLTSEGITENERHFF